MPSPMLAAHMAPGVLLVADPPHERYGYELLLTKSGRFVVREREISRDSPPRHQRISPEAGRMLLALPASARFDGLCLAYHRARTRANFKPIAPAAPEGQGHVQS